MTIRDLLETVESEGREDALGSVHPALQKLTLDTHRLVNGGADGLPALSDGFDSRAELIRWEQQLAVRSLGQVPMFVFHGIASQLASGRDRPLVEALVADSTLPDGASAEWRNRVRKKAVLPAFNRAYRELRKQATQYGTRSDEGDDHQPLTQRYIAMRPALDELNEWQRNALVPVLDPDGFEDADAILNWLPVVVNATHGEPIELPDEETVPPAEFVDRLHDRDPWTELLTDPERRRVREAFAARFLIPSFNAGARQLAPIASEVPQTDTENRKSRSL